MFAVRVWFLLGLAVAIAAGVACRELARQAHEAGRVLAAGLWTTCFYGAILAVIGNVWLVWLNHIDGDTDNKE